MKAKIVYAGLCGGMAEVAWIAAYGSLTGRSGMEVARQVALSVFPGIDGAAAGIAAAGIAIHLALSVAVALAYAAAVWPLARRMGAAASTAVAAAALAAIWAFNFFVVLPLLNPAFVSLLPLGATLASKLLFGVAMACALNGPFLPGARHARQS